MSRRCHGGVTIIATTSCAAHKHGHVASPTLAAETRPQPCVSLAPARSWALPPSTSLGSLPTWGGRQRWLTAVAVALATAEGQQIRRAHEVSAATVRAVARADAEAADYRSGRGVATSHATVARRIRRCPRSVAAARAVLAALGLSVTVAAGRYLTASERAAARAVHGRHQVRAASTRALTLPRRAWTICNLPRRGHKTSQFKSLRSTKRTRKRVPRQQHNRPLWIQRLAGHLVERLPWLGRRHLGYLCDALMGLGLTDAWTASDLITITNQRNLDAGLMAIPASNQRHPIRLFCHQVRAALNHGANPPATRAAAHAERQRWETERAARIAQAARSTAWRADPDAVARVTALKTTLKEHLRSHRTTR